MLRVASRCVLGKESDQKKVARFAFHKQNAGTPPYSLFKNRVLHAFRVSFYKQLQCARDKVSIFTLFNACTIEIIQKNEEFFSKSKLKRKENFLNFYNNVSLRRRYHDLREDK